MSTPEVPPVFLHIGAMKTGTTYLQRVLLDHRGRLAEDGYLFPGRTWRAQIRAAQEIAAMPRDPVLRREVTGAWDALRKEMLAHRGVGSIVSMEFLSHGSAEQARAAVESLAPAQVHVVLTLRDAVGIVPAQWQTDVRNAQTDTWPDYMASVRRQTGLRARLSNRLGDRLGRVAAGASLSRFQRFHDVAHIVEAWSPCVPPERFHVVTVPASSADPTLLWRRFAEVTGLDPALGELSERANESMGYASTELLRRVNLALTDVPASDYNPTVREKLAPDGLVPRSSQETRARLDRATFDFALGWNARSLDALSSAGLRLVGDPDDLPTQEQPRHESVVADDQPPPSTEELLAAATDALAAARDLVEARARRAAKRGVDAADLTGHEPGPPSALGDPVDVAAAEIAQLCRDAIEIRRRLQTTRS